MKVLRHRIALDNVFFLLLFLFLLIGNKEILFASSVNGNSIDFQFDGQLSANITPFLPFSLSISLLPLNVVVKTFSWRSHWPGKPVMRWYDDAMTPASHKMKMKIEKGKTGRKPVPLNCLNQRPVASCNHSCRLPHATSCCTVRATSAECVSCAGRANVVRTLFET